MIKFIFHQTIYLHKMKCLVVVSWPIFFRVQSLTRDLFLSKSGNRYVPIFLLIPLHQNEAHHFPHISPPPSLPRKSANQSVGVSISPNATITTNGANGPLPWVTTFWIHVATKHHIANKIHIAFPCHFLDSPPHLKSFLKKFWLLFLASRPIFLSWLRRPHLPAPQHN